MRPKRLWRANVKRRKDINVEFIEHALNPNQSLELVRILFDWSYSEGVAGYAERIRQARCRQTNEGWTGNDGNYLHKYTDRHHFLHTLVINTMLVNLIFLFSGFISFRVLLETPDYLVFC